MKKEICGKRGRLRGKHKLTVPNHNKKFSTNQSDVSVCNNILIVSILFTFSVNSFDSILLIFIACKCANMFKYYSQVNVDACHSHTISA